MSGRAAPPAFARLDLNLDKPRIDPADVLTEKLADRVKIREAQRADDDRLERDRAQRVARGRMSLLEFAMRTPEQRGPLDFDRFPWQRELLDNHAAEDQEQATEKSTQVGLTTIEIRMAAYHGAIRHHIVLYTFPTEKEIADISRQRIATMIRSSPLLLSVMDTDSINNVMQRQIGSGWLYFRGTNRVIDSIDADLVIFDEYNTSDQDNIDASERRVTGPMSAGLIRRLGVPTYPGFGITKIVNERTDLRIWHVKCELCNTWNPFHGYDAWAHNVDYDNAIVVCRDPDCRRPLDVRRGQWVAKHPDRRVRGYHVPKLIMHGAPISTLIENSKKAKPEQKREFYNRDLAQAWAPREGRLSLEQVQACQRPGLHLLPGLYSDKLVTMGVDVASARPLNVTIEESLSLDPQSYEGRKVFVGTIADGDNGRTVFENLCWLMDAFGVNMAAIDQGPDGLFARAFAARFHGRVYRCGFYTPRIGQSDAPTWVVRDDEQYVGLWRSVAISATLQRYRLQQVHLPNLDEIPRDFAEHLGNVARETEETQGGNKRDVYVQLGPIDYLTTEIYNNAAIEVFWRNYGVVSARGEGPKPTAHGAGNGYEPGSDVPTYRPGFGG